MSGTAAARRNRTRSAAGTFSGHRQRSRRICHQKCGCRLSPTTSGSSTRGARAIARRRANPNLTLINPMLTPNGEDTHLSLTSLMSQSPQRVVSRACPMSVGVCHVLCETTHGAAHGVGTVTLEIRAASEFSYRSTVFSVILRSY